MVRHDLSLVEEISTLVRSTYKFGLWCIWALLVVGMVDPSPCDCPPLLLFPVSKITVVVVVVVGQHPVVTVVSVEQLYFVISWEVFSSSSPFFGVEHVLVTMLLLLL